MREIVGYSEDVSSISEKIPTPVVSNCQYAMRRPSGLQRKQSRRRSSSSVHPVGRSVDRRFGPVRRERRHFSGVQALDVDIVRLDVGDAGRVGRELREHEARRRSSVRASLGGTLLIDPQLSQGIGPDVEHPVVTAGVVSPDLLRVGEDEQPLAVRRPRVVLDAKRCFPPGRNEAGRIQENGARTGHRVVAGNFGSGATLGLLHDRVGCSIREPAGRAKSRRSVGALLENPVDLGTKRRRAIDLLGLDRRREHRRDSHSGHCDQRACGAHNGR